MRVGHIVPVAGGECCDFCASRPFLKLYQRSNFTFNGRRVFQKSSYGAWAACSKCAELVDTNRWPELTERAFRKFAKLHGPISQHNALGLREQFREVHKLFREYRIREC